MNTSNPLLNTLGDATKKAVDNTKRAASEEVRRAGDQTANQITSTPPTPEQLNATRDEVEGIYGGKEATMDPATYNKKATEEKKRTSGLIEQILGQLLPNHKMVDDRREKMAQEHKREAEELGQPHDNQKQQEEEQKKQQEEEEKRKKNEKQAALDNPIEAPAGKTTGMSFGRKKSAPRMQRPPTSTAETRGGKGNRE